jgi:hypothetical protein
MPETSQQPAKRENLILNLAFNVGVPFLVLSKLSKETPWEPFGGIVSLPGLGPVWGLIAALCFPLGYGLFDLVSRKKWNLLSIIGLCGVLASGGLGLLAVDPFWFAVKEAAVPLVIGSVVFVSRWTRKPLVKLFLLNPELVDTQRLERALAERNAEAEFERLISRANLILGVLFVVSAILNFVVARAIVRSPGRTEAFNDELARMNLWSLAIITVPMVAGMILALLQLFKGIHRITGLDTEELMHKR